VSSSNDWDSTGAHSTTTRCLAHPNNQSHHPTTSYVPPSRRRMSFRLQFAPLLLLASLPCVYTSPTLRLDVPYPPPHSTRTPSPAHFDDPPYTPAPLRLDDVHLAPPYLDLPNPPPNLDDAMNAFRGRGHAHSPFSPTESSPRRTTSLRISFF